jgi:hypothetical protein
MIVEIPSAISQFKSLNNLFLHNNPIAKLPTGIHSIWDNLQEFSIDWFSYLFPFVGKMITRVQKTDSEENDSNQPGPEHKMKNLIKNKSQSFISGINGGNQVINLKINQKEKVK